MSLLSTEHKLLFFNENFLLCLFSDRFLAEPPNEV